MTPAARFIRVSSDRQDESSQIADCDAVAAREDLTFTMPDFRLHAVSGYKGEDNHAAALEAALEAVRDGRIRALVVAHSSRLTRRDPDEAEMFALQVRLAGGRIYSHDEQSYGSGDLLGRFASLMAHEQNNAYSRDLSNHINRRFRQIDTDGAYRGAKITGYTIEGGKYAKRLVPDPATAATVTELFKAAAAGDSLAKLSRTYAMDPTTIAGILRNPVYSTGRHERISHRDCTSCDRRKPGKRQSATCLTIVHRCQPLTDPATAAEALAAIEARTSNKNGVYRALRAGREDYSGSLLCPTCEAPLYRRYSGGQNRANGKAPMIRRYRCSSCGYSVRADSADEALEQIMSTWTETWYRKRLVPGDDHSADLARVRQELAELGSRGLSDEDEDEQRAKLRSERKRLESLPSSPARTITEVAGTYADRWNSLSIEDRREWLSSGEFKIVAKQSKQQRGAVELSRTMIDDGSRYDFEATADELANAKPGEFIWTGSV